MFRNIIWDVDGTLFDTYPAIAGAFLKALRDLGHDAELGQVMALAKISLTHCFDTLVETYHLDGAVFEQRFDEHYGRVTPQDQPPFPGVVRLCQRICDLGGKNVIVTHRGRKGTEELLAGHRMDGYFSGALTHNDGLPRKPDPAAFIVALERFELDPKETIAIGDRDIDILAGQAAGVFSCLFDSPGEGSTPDLTISHFDELSGKYGLFRS